MNPCFKDGFSKASDICCYVALVLLPPEDGRSLHISSNSDAFR